MHERMSHNPALRGEPISEESTLRRIITTIETMFWWITGIAITLFMLIGAHREEERHHAQEAKITAAIQNNDTVNFKGKQYHILNYNQANKTITLPTATGTITVYATSIE